MRTSHAKVPAIALALALVVGCATQDGTNQAAGAAIGALAGGLICTAAGGSAGVCVASAAGGAMLGWGAVKAKQVIDRRSDLAQTRSRTPAVVIRNYGLDPPALAPGQALMATTTYDLMTPPSVGPRPVTQTFRILTQEGKVVNSFTPIQGQLKEHGRYEVGWEIPIPAKAPPGQYQLVQVLDAQTASPEIRSATFQVVKRVSQAHPTNHSGG